MIMIPRQFNIRIAFIGAAFVAAAAITMEADAACDTAAWVYDDPATDDRAIWATDISAFNQLAPDTSAINTIYSYGGSFEYYDDLGGQVYFPEKERAVASVYSATAGVEHVIIVLDGRMDGGKNYSPDLSKVPYPEIKEWADRTAAKVCSHPDVEGVQIDLEPFREPYTTGLIHFLTRLSSQLRRRNNDCRNKSYPQGRSVSMFLSAHALTDNVWKALGPNGYAVISGYDLSDSSAGTPSSPTTYAARLGGVVDKMLSMGSPERRWMLGIPAAASTFEFERYVASDGSVVESGYEQKQFLEAAFDVIAEKELRETSGDSGYRGTALWGFATKIAYPPHSENVFTPSNPFQADGSRGYLSSKLCVAEDGGDGGDDVVVCSEFDRKRKCKRGGCLWKKKKQKCVEPKLRRRQLS